MSAPGRTVRAHPAGPDRRPASTIAPAVRPTTGFPYGLQTLQRLAGNRAVTTLLVGTRDRGQVTPTGPGGPTVQRAVILLDVNPQDYALQKVLTGLDPGNLRLVEDKATAWNFAVAKQQNPALRCLMPYLGLVAVGKEMANIAKSKGDDALIETDEDIHVVGHGFPGGVWTAPGHGGETKDLSTVVTAIKRVAGDDWTGGVRVLTCRSEVGDDKSVAGKLRQGLGPGADVSGQTGFAYGMGAHRAGMAVLKPEFDALYKADTFDRAVAKRLLARAKTTDAARQLINFDPTNKAAYPTAAKQEEGVWDAFVVVMKAIEKQLNDEVTRARNPEPDILTKAQQLENSAHFQGLIADQDRLFTLFDLWA